MFIVYGLNPEMERRHWPFKHPKRRVETPEQYRERMNEALRKMRPKVIAEYDNLEVAKQYVEKAQQAGMTGLSIKFRKLVPTGKPKKPVRQILVDVSELPNIDPNEQDELKALRR